MQPLDASVFLKRCCDYGRLLSLFSICLRLIVSKYIEAPRLQSSHPSVDDIDYQVAAFLLVPAFIDDLISLGISLGILHFIEESVASFCLFGKTVTLSVRRCVCWQR